MKLITIDEDMGMTKEDDAVMILINSSDEL
jgi:hypothetical protein